MSEALDISILVRNSATAYSGGRYHSLMMAVALAHAGHRVRYLTSRIPAFYHDLTGFPALARVEMRVVHDFAGRLPEGPCDVAVVVPGMDREDTFYHAALRYATERGARVALLHFEDPLWFNALSPTPRDPALWNGWTLIARYAALILANSRASRDHARAFYTECPPQVRFEYAYPPINHPAADAAGPSRPEKRIFMLTRFEQGDHKGGCAAAELICEAIRGYTLVLVTGRGRAPWRLLAELRRKGREHGVDVEVKYRLSDAEKFRELRRAALLVFPSRFEGFGYPPVEARYCGVPCIAFDLPVLREHSGDATHFVPPGDWAALRRRMGEVLAGGEEPPGSAGADFATIDFASGVFSTIFERLMDAPPIAGYVPVPLRRVSLARRIYRQLRG